MKRYTGLKAEGETVWLAVEWALLIFAGICFVWLFYFHSKQVKRSARSYKKELFAARRRIANKKQMLDAVLEESKQVEKDLEEVRVIYQSLKSMGAVLEFSETMDIFFRAIQHWRPFKKGILSLTEKEEGQYRAGNIYEVEIRPGQNAPRIELKNKEYAREAKQIFEQCRRQTHPFVLEQGTLFEPGAVVIPLVSEQETMGFIALDQPVKHGGGDVARKGSVVDILVHEFALEIKKKMFYEKVKALSVSDSLTGTFLRKYIFQKMEKELQRCRQQKSVFSLLLVDIDDFKKANDTFGHLAGDALLKRVADLLKENSREIDLVGRYGGDEFLVMLPDAGQEDTQKVIERIQGLVRKSRLVFSGKPIVPLISMGAATYPQDGTELEQLLSCADQRLYQEKEASKIKTFEGKNE